MPFGLNIIFKDASGLYTKQDRYLTFRTSNCVFFVKSNCVFFVNNCLQGKYLCNKKTCNGVAGFLFASAAEVNRQSWIVRIEEGTHDVSARWMAQLAQGLGFDLADAL
ncbi:MAG: hypothetical protein ACOVKN_08880, partial [Arenimonas sp.]